MTDDRTQQISLKAFVKFPLKVDGPGIYVFDAAGDIVADCVPRSSSNGALHVAVDACNDHMGHPTNVPPLPATLAAPFRFDPDEIEVVDARGQRILRIRGWGHLKRNGHDKAVAIQELLGTTFATALNARFHKRT